MQNSTIFEIIKNSILIAILSSFIYSIYLITFIQPLTNIQYLHGLFSIIIFGYYNWNFHNFIFIKIQERNERLDKRYEQERLINDFFENDLDYDTSEELNQIIKHIENFNFLPEVNKKHIEKIQMKLIEAKNHLKTLIHEEEIKTLESKKEALMSNIRNLEYIENEKTMTDEDRKQELIDELDIDNNKVFYKEDLSIQQIEALKEIGYKQTNEYCFRENKNITVLIKPVLNHTNTHTFVVWSIMEYLDYGVENISKITEHETKDADITFKYRNRIYAVEIETGSLLKKKRQANEKVESLNQKYKERWMFVVTNKNLVPKYRKLGFTTQRTQLIKDLNKLLKIDT